jgi:hypothetical protein
VNKPFFSFPGNSSLFFRSADGVQIAHHEDGPGALPASGTPNAESAAAGFAEADHGGVGKSFTCADSGDETAREALPQAIHLLLPEFAKKLRDTPVPKVYICNLMTQPEETEGMDIITHLQWVSAALGGVPDYILVNNEHIPDGLTASYSQEGAAPLYLDRPQRKKIAQMGSAVIELPAVQITDGKLLRHNSYKLAETLFRLCRELGAKGERD